MMNTLLRVPVVALAIAAAPVPAAAQDMDHSGHGTHHSDKTGSASEDVSGAEDILEAYRAALVSRDAAGMSALFAEASAIFENGKSEGSFANYMEHHLGPELDAITSFTFTDPTLTMTRKGHMAYGYETYGYRIELEDGRVIERDGVATSVLSHDELGWKIVQYHSSSRAPRRP